MMPTQQSSQQRPPIRTNTDLWGAAVLVLFAGVALLLAGGDNPQVWVFPRSVGGVLLALAAGLAVRAIVRRERREVIDRDTGLVTVTGFAVGLVAYYLLMSRLGFLITTILGFAAATWVLRRRFTIRSAVVSLAVATALALVLYQVFGEVFNVPLPVGQWWEALGLV